MQVPWRRKAEEILLFGLIWGLVGSIFGGLFVVFLESLRGAGYAPFALVGAGALAGSVGAAFYGAMQVAILGTLAGVIATFVYLVSVGDQANVLVVFAVAGAAGAVLGAGFGAMHLFLTRGALSKALAGLVGGLVAALVLWLALALIPRSVPIHMSLVTGALVPITGYVYVALVGRFEDRLEGRIPLPFVGAVVAAILAAVIGASVWAVGGTVTGILEPAVQETIDRALSQMPAALVGGALGGLLAGTLLALQRQRRRPNGQ